MGHRDTRAKLTSRQRRLWYAARKARWAVVAVLIVGAVIVADRVGSFGVRPTPPQPDAAKYDGKRFAVARIVDGDTIDVDVPDGDRGQTRVRFWGVDTPETKHPNRRVQHFGPEADAFTRSACRGREVTLRLVPGRTRGKHGRLLAYVFLPDGRMLNRELVRAGYAYADPRYDHPHKAEFRRLQAEARSARRGLWKNVRPVDLPYYYRETLGKP